MREAAIQRQVCFLSHDQAFFGRPAACGSEWPSLCDERSSFNPSGREVVDGRNGTRHAGRQAVPYFFGGASQPGTSTAAMARDGATRGFFGNLQSRCLLPWRFSSSWSAYGFFLWFDRVLVDPSMLPRKQWRAGL
jgi:hypothetical protein